MPSIRYGSFSVETSNQPIRSLPPATIRPQSSMRPFTRNTFAPCRAISRTFTSGVSAGQNTYDSIPALAAYAARAAPALPFVGIATRLIPKLAAMLIAMATPRALNEPVGRRHSSLTTGAITAWRRPMASRLTRAVAASPSETMSAVRRTGKNSR